MMGVFVLNLDEQGSSPDAEQYNGLFAEALAASGYFVIQHVTFVHSK